MNLIQRIGGTTTDRFEFKMRLLLAVEAVVVAVFIVVGLLDVVLS